MPETYKGLEVAVVGMGKSNQALCRYLLGEGALLTCFDRKTREELGEVYQEFSNMGVKWSLGPDYLDKLPGYRYIFLTPGMKKHQPQVIEAKQRGAEISTEIYLFLKRCKAVVGGVTGSAGKTTTCMLVKLMLEHSMPDTPIFLGGNIGPVLIEQVDRIPENARVVLELSSFQLHLCTRSPQYALLLNIRPNHLDIHKDFDEYTEAKKNIFRFQSAKDLAVLNYDESLTRAAAAECPGRTGFFSLKGYPETKPGPSNAPVAWLQGDDLVYDPGDGTPPCVVGYKQDFRVPGHTTYPTPLAQSCSQCRWARILKYREAIRKFRGIEHRIEFVRELDGVCFYNDSIATSPDRTIALIDSLEGPLVLILGGYDKGLPFDELAERIVARRCKVVLIGRCADKIRQAVERAWAGSDLAGRRALTESGPSRICTGRPQTYISKPEMAEAGGLEDAVLIAFSMAEPGSSVVLSPACASYDMFSSFEERGRLFKQVVKAL